MGVSPESSTLFVCAANQCRSPMAEALLKHKIEISENQQPNWLVASAGCWAYPNRPATTKAVLAVENLGAVLERHQSQAVSADLLDKFNLVLCMENIQVDFIKRHFPKAADRVFLLSEMADQFFEINDPIGRDETHYLDTAKEIKTIIEEGWEKIHTLSAIRTS